MASISSASSDFYFPEDLLLHVLSFLPAKEICKNRVVCKSFNEYSGYRNFCMLQSAHTKDRFAGLIMPYSSTPPCLQLFSIDPCQSVPDEFMLPPTANIFGCVDGMLIYEDDDNDGISYVGIVNPVTGEEQRISHPSSNGRKLMSTSSALMIVEEEEKKNGSFDYKLVCFYPTEEWSCNIDIYVYCSKRETWMITPNFNMGGFDVDLTHPILIGKTIYFVPIQYSWLVHRPHFIAGIDTEDGDHFRVVDQKMALPSGVDVSKDLIEIAHWRKDWTSPSFCLISFHHESSTFKIWIMEDLKNGRWSEKSIDVSMESMGFPPHDQHYVHVFTVINDDKLMFYKDGAMHMYGLKDGIRTEICSKVQNYFVNVFPYANTMHPC